MPIKPENRARYPKDWKQIVSKVRERSGDCCEGSPAYPDCRRPNGSLLNKRTGEITTDSMIAEVWQLVDGDRVVKIVLTTAHLNHVPEDCDLDNLRHWCQRCHLQYDAAHHAINARATRQSKKAIGDLFGMEQQSLTVVTGGEN